MDKKAKAFVILVIVIIIFVLLFLLIYSNFFRSHYSQQNGENLNKNNYDVYIEKEYTYENITMHEFNYSYDKNEQSGLFTFKITNNTGENLNSFYINLYLKNMRDEVIYYQLIEIPRLDNGMTRYISFETKQKINNVKTFEFKKVLVEGVG